MDAFIYCIFYLLSLFDAVTHAKFIPSAPSYVRLRSAMMVARGRESGGVWGSVHPPNIMKFSSFSGEKSKFSVNFGPF